MGRNIVTRKFYRKGTNKQIRMDITFIISTPGEKEAATWSISEKIMALKFLRECYSRLQDATKSLTGENL